MARRPSGGWHGQAGSRHDRGYGSAWDRLRETILQRDDYLCQQCLRDGRLTPLKVRPYDHAVDHIIPKAKGGTDDPDNLQSLCAPCHDAKTEADLDRRKARQVGPDGYPLP